MIPSTKSFLVVLALALAAGGGARVIALEQVYKPRLEDIDNRISTADSEYKMASGDLKMKERRLARFAREVALTKDTMLDKKEEKGAMDAIKNMAKGMEEMRYNVDVLKHARNELQEEREKIEEEAGRVSLMSAGIAGIAVFVGGLLLSSMLVSKEPEWQQFQMNPEEDPFRRD